MRACADSALEGREGLDLIHQQLELEPRHRRHRPATGAHVRACTCVCARTCTLVRANAHAHALGDEGHAVASVLDEVDFPELTLADLLHLCAVQGHAHRCNAVRSTVP